MFKSNAYNYGNPHRKNYLHENSFKNKAFNTEEPHILCSTLLQCSHSDYSRVICTDRCSLPIYTQHLPIRPIPCMSLFVVQLLLFISILCPFCLYIKAIYSCLLSLLSFMLLLWHCLLRATTAVKYVTVYLANKPQFAMNMTRTSIFKKLYILCQSCEKFSFFICFISEIYAACLAWFVSNRKQVFKRMLTLC